MDIARCGGAHVRYATANAARCAHWLLRTTKPLPTADVQIAVMLLTVLILITSSMIWGVLRGRPSMVLPFFAYLVFDFVVSCLTAVGHTKWLPRIQRFLEAEHVDFTHADSQWLALFILFVCICVLLAKVGGTIGDRCVM